MPSVRIVALGFCAALAAAAAVAESGTRRQDRLTTEDVREIVATLPPPLTREVSAMRYVLTADELIDLLSDLRPHRLRAWMDDWWLARDPIPTTPENEARTIHEDRTLAAHDMFARGSWPGWDDRGETLIRYGYPGWRSDEPSEVLAPGVLIPAKETWYYPQFGVNVQFTDVGENGFVYYLERVMLPVGERPRNDRRTIASEYNPDTQMDFMPVDMDASGFYNLAPPFAEKGYDAFMKTVFLYEDVVEKMPSAYPYDFPWMRIPGAAAVHSFRAGSGKDRVDVSAEFVSAVTPLPRAGGYRRFVTTSVFWNALDLEIARYERVDSVGTGPWAEDSLATVVNQTTLTLPPGTYRFAVTVQEIGTNRVFALRRVVGCHDMDTDLAMSDVMLAREIGEARDTSPFNRGAFEVVPRPSGRYRVGTPVPVYFEVYMRGAGDGRFHAYTVEYTIKPRTPRPRGFWSRFVGQAEEPLDVGSRFDALAFGATDAVRVFANTQDLWPGEFTLEVSVTDGESLRRVTRETTFRLYE